MKIQIIKAGTFSDFETQPGKAGAIRRQAGDKVDYPAWYAESLVESGWAVPVAEEVEEMPPDVVEEELPEDEPGVIKSELAPITPAALDYATEHDIDLFEIKGTGSGGRITLKDVRG